MVNHVSAMLSCIQSKEKNCTASILKSVVETFTVAVSHSKKHGGHPDKSGDAGIWTAAMRIKCPV